MIFIRLINYCSEKEIFFYRLLADNEFTAKNRSNTAKPNGFFDLLHSDTVGGGMHLKSCFVIRQLTLLTFNINIFFKLWNIKSSTFAHYILAFLTLRCS